MHAWIIIFVRYVTINTVIQANVHLLLGRFPHSTNLLSTILIRLAGTEQNKSVTVKQYPNRIFSLAYSSQHLLLQLQYTRANNQMSIKMCVLSAN